MDTTLDTVREVVQGYAGEALNGYSYLMTSEDGTMFSIVSVGKVREKRIVNTGIVVRVDGDRIIIEHDANDKPLVDALIQAGIPRNNIHLAYLQDTKTG